MMFNAPLIFDEVVQDLAKNAQIADGKLSYTGLQPHIAFCLKLEILLGSSFPEELLLHF